MEYTYDAYNRRIAKVIDPDGAGSATAQTERMVYDGDNIALTFDGTGTQTHRYLYGPGVDQVLADETPTSVNWALADNQGTIRDVIDSQGQVLNHIVYDSYGQVTSETNPSLDFRYGYTGRERDKETGLSYNRARYYDTATGCFISQDPIGFLASDSNLSRYIFNDPVNRIDPSGLHAQFDDGFTEITRFVEGGGGSGGGGLDDGIPSVRIGPGSSLNNEGLGGGGGSSSTELTRSLENRPVGGEGNYKGNVNTTPQTTNSSNSNFCKLSDRPKNLPELTIDSTKYPESAQHIRDAQASGHSSEVTLDRKGATQNRKESLKGYATKPKTDRDEYPPAMFKEGGRGASVRNINSSDNRGSGSSLGHQARPYPDGTRFQIRIIP